MYFYQVSNLYTEKVKVIIGSPLAQDGISQIAVGKCDVKNIRKSNAFWVSVWLTWWLNQRIKIIEVSGLETSVSLIIWISDVHGRARKR